MTEVRAWTAGSVTRTIEARHPDDKITVRTREGCYETIKILNRTSLRGWIKRNRAELVAA